MQVVYTPGRLTIKIPVCSLHHHKFKNVKIQLTWDQNFYLDITGTNLHIAGQYDIKNKNFIVTKGQVTLDDDTYRVAGPSQVWPVVKDLKVMQGGIVRLHVDRVTMEPLRCSKLIVNKFPLKHIGQALQDSFLSMNLQDFSGNFSCQFPHGIAIVGEIKNQQYSDDLNWHAFVKNGQKVLLQAQGTLKNFYLLHNAQLDMTCNGHIDLAPFSFLMPGHMRGVLKAAFTADGLLRQLNVLGYVSLSEGYFEDIHSGVILEDVRMRTDFQGHHIVLQDFYCNDHSAQKGTITARGKYDLGEDQGEIHVHVQNFQPMHYTPIYARVSGPITVKMSPHWHTTGKLVAKNVLVQYDQFKKPYHRFEILDADNPHKQKKIKLGFMRDGLIDIALDGQAEVKGKALKSFWEGKLELLCKNGKWKFLGHLDGKRGELLFFGKRMKMRYGKITFDDKKDPRLNMEFDIPVEDHKIIVTLKGRGNDTRANVSAEPALHTEDAYAYLLFGTNKQSLSNFQTIKLFTAIATANTSGEGVLQKLTSLIDVRQKQNNGQEEEVLRFAQPLGAEEKTELIFEQSLVNKDITAKIERQITNSIKADIGIKSSSVKRSNFGGELGLGFEKNY